MLFYFKVRVDHSGLTEKELWDLWEKETEASIGGMEAGKIVAAYKVSGQRRVVGILNVDSHDELDQLLMGGLPMSHVLEWEEILAVRDYRDFAADVRNRWQ